VFCGREKESLSVSESLKKTIFNCVCDGLRGRSHYLPTDKLLAWNVTLQVYYSIINTELTAKETSKAQSIIQILI